MKLHIITVGKPKLDYAKSGWDEYLRRIERYHTIRLTAVPDKQNDAAHLLAAAEGTFLAALDGKGSQVTSPELAQWLDKKALESREVSFMIGGPVGLPKEVIDQADFHWSLSKLTFPHDLSMVILLEALYRASTINAGHPYHKQ